MATKILNVPVASNRGANSPGGINSRDDSIGFGGRFSPAIKNMMVEPTRVRKRLGYTIVGANLPLTGVGTGLFEYVDAKGGKHLIAMTTTKAYEYSATTNLWTDVSPVTPCTGDVDDPFRGGVVTDTALFTNNGGSALVLTNNTDNLIYYEGDTSDVFATLVHGYPSFANCVDVVEFWNHFVLIGVTDSSYHCRRIDYADFADADDWSGGTSGSSVLTDSIGALMRAVKLGAYLVLYSERSISLCQYGNADVVFVVPTLIFGTGLVCKDAVWGDALSHRFVGSDHKIWRYDGGSLLYRVGDVIEQELFKKLNYALKHRMRTGYDTMRQKFLIAFPRAGDTYAKAVYAQNLGLPGEPWEYYELAHDIVGVATLEATTTAYCDYFQYGASGYNPWANLYCDEVAVYCDDPFGQASAPACVFQTSDGYVFKFDDAVGSDNGTAIECSYETEDITVDIQHSYARWLKFSFTARSLIGGSAYIYYSVDEGETWVELADSPVTLSTAWTTHRLPLSAASEMIRFKIWQNEVGDLQLRGLFRVEVEPGVARS